MKTLRLHLIAIFVLLSSVVSAQLPTFTLDVAATAQTCLGNGNLTFNTSGTVSGATISYTIFLQPDLVTPIATTTTNSISGLVAGNYVVTATQTLGADSSSVTQNSIVDNQIVPLNYTVSSTNAFCGADGSIMINVTSGSPAEYEILSGPITPPIQTSPAFNNVPAGIYVIRVYDNCGDGIVVTHTVQTDATVITVEAPSFPDAELPSCNTITVKNSLTSSANGVLTYPLILDYTVYPPDGSTPISYNQILSTGFPNNQEAEIVLPFYYDQPYTYDLVVTDECGTTYTSTHTIHEKLELSLSALPAECGQYFLTTRASKYGAPYTLTFTSSPAGFNPISFNTSYPGPFSTQEVEFGNFNNPVPFGDYIIQINDGCGRTATANVSLEYIVPEPMVELTPNLGCDGARSKFEISIMGYQIVFAEIIAAPTAYSATLPQDVSSFIDIYGIVVMNDMPAGNYTINLIDDCGTEYEYEFNVPIQDPTVSLSLRADCDAGFGSVRLRGNSTQLLSVIMTSAPAAFGQTMPYDVSFLINASGIFSIANLPIGAYGFTIVDSCNFTHTKAFTFPAYAASSSDFNITPHCGSFDLDVAYVANGYVSVNLWLQEFDPMTGLWGHPITGVPYLAGTQPNALNSLALVNNSNNLNLEVLGQFRVMRTYESYQNGDIALYKTCFDVVHEFEFTGEIQITGIVKVTCNGLFSDVEVFTNGVPPVYFQITEKNLLPFIIDNGTNPIFTNLEPALYTVSVSHSCGDTRTQQFDVALLPSLATANQPPNLETCDDSSNDGQAAFNLSDQNAAIIGSQNASDFAISYHATLADAEADVNPLPVNFTSGPTTVFARLRYINTASTCYDITSFDLIIYPSPVLNMDTSVGLCEGTSTTLSAPFGFNSYLWSTGQGTRNIVISEPGIYELIVTDNHGSISCTASQTIVVTLSNSPEIEEILVDDWTDNQNSITVQLTPESLGVPLYSIDNINFQTSPTFTNLLPGAYTVYVKDELECGFDQQEVYLLNYPKFFTPNGDGFNDYWRVPFSEVEPHLQTFIYDRYGKLITGFDVNSFGWDGTLNGHQLPSTDYWFLIIRENGKRLRGHFSMKR